MDRDQFEDMLADYLGNELSPADRRAFEEHLARSTADRAEVESLRGVLSSLRQLPPPPAIYAEGGQPPGPSRGAGQPRLLRYLYRPLAYAAVLLIGVSVGWFARPTTTTTPTGTGPPTSTTIEIRAPRFPTAEPTNPFVRNVLALSSAFSQPTGTTTVPSRPTG